MIIRLITISALLLINPLCVYAQDSTCYGTASNGHLENGVQLPSEGANL